MTAIYFNIYRIFFCPAGLCGVGEIHPFRVATRGAGGPHVEEDQRLCSAEQVRATQKLTDEQVGQTRSRTKAARTQATPSARTSGAAVIEEEEAEGVE